MTCPLSECQRTAKTLRTLRTLSSSLHATVDTGVILELLIAEAAQLVGAERALVAICCEDGTADFRQFREGKPVPVAGWTPDSGTPGSVVLSVEPFFSNDPLRDPLVDRGVAAENAVRCVASVPIASRGGDVAGYLELQNKSDPAGFSELDVEELKSVAQIAAQALANARAYRKIADDAAELELRVAERTAQLQESNEELQNFTTTVSHNLRAPLRAIQGFAQILLEAPGSSEHGELLGRIQAAAQSMDHLVEDLLAYSRTARQELLSRTVDLNLALREAEQQVKLAQEGRVLGLEVARPLPPVRGDHAALVQVLYNLLSNAVTYVAPGVTPHIRVSAQAKEGSVRLLLQDNGIGIRQEDQDRIFRPFERLHGSETYPGTGLGLAIARRVVQRLGGTLGVQSRPGEGSRFWVELPAAEVAAGAVRG